MRCDWCGRDRRAEHVDLVPPDIEVDPRVPVGHRVAVCEHCAPKRHRLMTARDKRHGRRAA